MITKSLKAKPLTTKDATHEGDLVRIRAN